MQTNGNKKPLTRDEFGKQMPELTVGQIDMLWTIFQQQKDNDAITVEYWVECSMCGVEMMHRECGMCTRCEMVWNS